MARGANSFTFLTPEGSIEKQLETDIPRPHQSYHFDDVILLFVHLLIVVLLRHVGGELVVDAARLALVRGGRLQAH